MSTVAVVETKNTSLKETLVAMVEPKNPILSRLQKQFSAENNKGVVFGYSRMHNRHNRS